MLIQLKLDIINILNDSDHHSFLARLSTSHPSSINPSSTPIYLYPYLSKIIKIINFLSSFQADPPAIVPLLYCSGDL